MILINNSLNSSWLKKLILDTNFDKIKPIDILKDYIEMNSHIEEEPFDPNRPILPNWRIASSGQHFYRYGISQYRDRCRRRSKLYDPLLVFIISFVMTVKSTYFAITPQKSPDFHILFGDFGSFMPGIHRQLNLGLSLCFCVAHLSQTYHIYQYLRSRGQSYLKLFDMMSGRI